MDGKNREKSGADKGGYFRVQFLGEMTTFRGCPCKVESVPFAVRSGYGYPFFHHFGEVWDPHNSGCARIFRTLPPVVCVYGHPAENLGRAKDPRLGYNSVPKKGQK